MYWAAQAARCRSSGSAAGSWGADWGHVDEADALAVLHAAVDEGVTFLDTADVYGDGRSETLIGRFLTERTDVELTVATKMGRRADPHVPAAFTLDAFRGWVDRSRRNLGVDTLDLVQLHCPPTPVLSDDRVYDALDTLVADGRIAAYGVSVETVQEALTAIARPGVATVQIIVNIFRRKPLEQVLPAAAEAGVGVIARVPLASGLLTGKYDESTEFSSDDHRSFNRNGEAFDVGETFSGVPFDVGVRAAREVAEWTPERRVDRAAGPAMAYRPGRHHHRHPRRPESRAGQGQRARRGVTSAQRAGAGRDGGDLRQPDQRARPRSLVTAGRSATSPASTCAHRRHHLEGEQVVGARPAEVDRGDRYARVGRRADVAVAGLHHQADEPTTSTASAVASAAVACA